MRIWSLQDAKARFSELVATCLEDGPQMVTRRGHEAVVVVPAAEWKRMTETARPTLKEWLLAEHPRFDLGLPLQRRKFKRRPPLTFED